MSEPVWPEAAGSFLQNIPGGTPEPGPPYVHTLTLPQQPVFSRSGKLVYRPPDRTAAFTIGEIRPPGQRIEVTYLTDGP